MGKSAERKIVDQCNALARRMYASMGYVQDDKFRFYESTHPQERSVWNLAVMAYEHIEGTDVEDCLNQVGDEGYG